MSGGRSLPPLSGGAPKQMVAMLHGYGSNGADMIALAPAWRRSLPDALLLAPDAPERCAGAPGGFQWWGLQSLDRAALAAGARRAAPALDAWLDAKLAEHEVAADKLLLVGFSQGTMMALHVGLRRQTAGIVGYSGMLAEATPPSGEVTARPRILLVHGDRDTIVPVSALHDAETNLGRLGCAVATHVAPGLGHGVDAAGIALGQRFASDALA